MWLVANLGIGEEKVSKGLSRCDYEVELHYFMAWLVMRIRSFFLLLPMFFLSMLMLMWMVRRYLVMRINRGHPCQSVAGTLAKVLRGHVERDCLNETVELATKNIVDRQRYFKNGRYYSKAAFLSFVGLCVYFMPPLLQTIVGNIAP